MPFGKMIHLFAPAKVNLGLRVLNRRPDGFHNIDSIFQAVSLYDRLSIVASDEFSFSATGLWQVPTGMDNIVVKAVNLLCEKLCIEPNFRLILEKQIPPGSGLGGGSSDAVAALIGCNSVVQNPMNPDELKQLAARIGSDCPFFFQGGLQHISGRGERLNALSGSVEGAFAVWFPGISIGTADAYRALNRSLTQVESSLILHDCFLSTSDWWKEDEVVNDFESVIAPNIPDWNDASQYWFKQGAKWVSLTGSGSCQIAFFTSRSECEHACNAWHLSGKVWATTPVPVGVHTIKVGDV